MNSSLHPMPWTLVRIYHSRLGSLLIALLLLLQRSPALRWIWSLRVTTPPPLLQPAVRFLIPASVSAGTLHTLSGATVVQAVAPSSNPALAEAGEPFVWVFRTTPHAAMSYSAAGLPPGVNLSGVIQHGVSSLVGTPTTPGLYQAEITGYEKLNLSGGRTPVFRLVINVEAGDPPSIVTPPQGGEFTEGEDVLLEVVAEGSGLNYRWLHDGEPLESEIHSLIAEDGLREVFVPSSDPGGTWRSQIEGFDLSGWTSGFGGVGFKVPTETTYDPFIGVDIEEAMRRRSTSALIRMPFSLDPAHRTKLTQLRLAIQYDDGFAAHLNGIPAAAANAPATPAWNAAAQAGRDDALAVLYQDIDLSARLGDLRDGANLLAIQGLNQRSDSDFLINARLEGVVQRDLPQLRIPRASASHSGFYIVEVRSGDLMVQSDPVELRILPAGGFASWRHQNWSPEEILQPETSGPLADADGDGKSNLEEYAVGGNPRLPRESPTLTIEPGPEPGGGILLRIPWNVRQPDVDYLFQRAVDPASGAWETLVDGTGGISLSEDESGLTAEAPAGPFALFRALFRLR